jgi:hypothetical protein
LAHLFGGDLTQGGVDEVVRHAVTKMASLHFAATEQSAELHPPDVRRALAGPHRGFPGPGPSAHWPLHPRPRSCAGNSPLVPGKPLVPAPATFVTLASGSDRGANPRHSGALHRDDIQVLARVTPVPTLAIPRSWLHWRPSAAARAQTIRSTKTSIPGLLGTHGHGRRLGWQF